MTTATESWKLDDAGPNSGNLIRAEIRQGDAIIAELPCPDAHPEYDIGRKQWLANAKLLTAAPDLLALCDELRADLISLGWTPLPHVDATIAKAKGREATPCKP